MISGCAPQEVEVTRMVEVPVTVEVSGPTIEVTRVIEREVVTEAIEVTKVVPATPPANQPTGRLVVEVVQPPASLDVAKAVDSDSRTVAWQLYDSLVYVNDQGRIRPALAETWTISPNFSQYTFNLRPNVTFHNGEPFNADAVLFSWRRGMASETSNAAAWQAVTNIEVIDDLTLTLTLAQSNPRFLLTIANSWAIVPPAYINSVGEEGFAAAPVGTGPFVFAEADPGNFVRLRANPDYWDPQLPKLQEITFRFVTSATDRLAAIRSGSLHIQKVITAEEAAQLYRAPNINIITYPQDRIYYIAFNNRGDAADSPLEDPQVRQALNYAVDKQAIISTLFDNYAQAIGSLFTSSNYAYNSAVAPFPHDPDLARSLLAEAGFADGFEIDFACPDNAYPSFNTVCEMVKANLAEVGVTANLTFVSPDTYFDAYNKYEVPPLAGNRRTDQGGETYERLSSLLGGEFALWIDEDMQALVKLIGETPSQTGRAEQYTEIQTLIHDDPPFIYLYAPLTLEAINAAVQNYRPRQNGVTYFKEVILVTP